MDSQLSSEDVFGGGTPLDKLLEELDNLYPQYNPSPTDSDRLIMYRAGQRSVVEFILSKKQNV